MEHPSDAWGPVFAGERWLGAGGGEWPVQAPRAGSDPTKHPLSLSLSLSAGPGIMSTICRYRGAARTLDTGTRCPELMRTSPDIGHWSALVTPSAMDSHSVMKSKICLLQILERIR